MRQVPLEWGDRPPGARWAVGPDWRSVGPRRPHRLPYRSTSARLRASADPTDRPDYDHDCPIPCGRPDVRRRPPPPPATSGSSATATSGRWSPRSGPRCVPSPSRTAPVIDGFGPGEWSQGGRGQVLAPWPNRLGDGRYTFEETEAQAALNEPSRRNAIHGLVRWMPWRMMGRAQNRVSMAVRAPPVAGLSLRPAAGGRVPAGAGWPDGGDRRREHRGRPTSLRLGFHPYLTVGTPTVDQVRLRVPAEQRLIADDRGLPTGRGPVAGTRVRLQPGPADRCDPAGHLLHRPESGRGRSGPGGSRSSRRPGAVPPSGRTNGSAT